MSPFDQDGLTLKEELRVAFQTAYSTGQLDLVLVAAHTVQMHTKDFSGVTSDIRVYSVGVIPGRDKVVVMRAELSPFEVTEPLFLAFLREPMKQTGNSNQNVEVQVEHLFSHVHIAVAAFFLTMVALSFAYGCFLAKSCRVRSANLAKGAARRVRELQTPSTLLAKVRSKTKTWRKHHNSEGAVDHKGDVHGVLEDEDCVSVILQGGETTFSSLQRNPSSTYANSGSFGDQEPISF